MEQSELLRHVDHTLLAPGATLREIYAVLEDAMAYRTASACIPPCYVREAKAYVGDRLPICTVIGFPNGASAPEVKEFEAQTALSDGADEIDMVLNIGRLKAGEFAFVRDEIARIKRVCGTKILKVIVEACLLTEAEKIASCAAVTEGGADFIKTSTGFSTGGATREDVLLFRKHVGAGVKIKAAGGIRSLKDAEDFLALGCDRLGTSAIVRLIKEGSHGDAAY